MQPARGIWRGLTTLGLTVFVACGSQTTPGTAPTSAKPSAPPSTAPAPRPTTSTGPTPAGRTIMSTEADNGHAYLLHLGDRLAVRLSAPAIYTWTLPTSSDDRVLHRTAGSPGKTATASFAAALPGEAQVTAVANPDCYPGCLPPSRLFRVSVSVG